MRSLIALSFRVLEGTLKSAEVGHTSAAAFIFLNHVNAPHQVEVALGILSVVAALLLVWDLGRVVIRVAKFIKQKLAGWRVRNVLGFRR